MSRRAERRDRLTSPKDKPIQAFFMPHGPFDTHHLEAFYDAANRMLTDNPGKRVAILTEMYNGEQRKARAQTELVLRGTLPSEAVVQAGYKAALKESGLVHSEARFAAVRKVIEGGIYNNIFVSAAYSELDTLAADHERRVLWVEESNSPELVARLESSPFKNNDQEVPLLESTGSTSYEVFVDEKIAQMRASGQMQRERDDNVKGDLRAALARKDVAGAVLWRGLWHQNIGTELADEGYAVEAHAVGGTNGITLAPPYAQITRELAANPDREMTPEELDLAIKASIWYDGHDQWMLQRVNGWVEGRKAATGIQTVGQRELVVVTGKTIEALAAESTQVTGDEDITDSVVQHYLEKQYTSGDLRPEDFLQPGKTVQSFLGTDSDSDAEAMLQPNICIYDYVKLCTPDEQDSDRENLREHGNPREGASPEVETGAMIADDPDIVHRYTNSSPSEPITQGDVVTILDHYGMHTADLPNVTSVSMEVKDIVTSEIDE